MLTPTSRKVLPIVILAPMSAASQPMRITSVTWPSPPPRGPILFEATIVRSTSGAPPILRAESLRRRLREQPFELLVAEVEIESAGIGIDLAALRT